MLVYATPEQLAAWTDTASPANAAQLLRSASLLITDAIANAVYDVDGTGLPTDSDKVDALSDATCAQAAAWAALGIDPAAGPAGVTGAVQSSSIAGGSVSYAVSSTAGDDRAAAAARLTGEALLILRQAGLLTGAILVLG